MNVIKDLSLEEISVVDRGAARDSRIKLVKAAPRRAVTFSEIVVAKFGGQITPPEKVAHKRPVSAPVPAAPVTKAEHPLVSAAKAAAQAAKR